jgi:iron(III) transport system substrate-binding protein
MRTLDRRGFLRHAAAASVALSAGRAFAQGSGDGDWAKLVAAANDEGKLVIIVAPNPLQRDFLLKQFKEDFPKIDLSISLISGSSFVPSVTTERAAGKYLWDIHLTGPNTGHLATKAGLFDPLMPEFVTQEAKDEQAFGGWNQAFYDEERKYVLSLVNDIETPTYNAKQIAPARAKAEGLKLLLDPAIKGKTVWFDPRIEGPGAPFMALIYRKLGAEALWRIMVDQDPFFVRSQNEVAEALVRGKAVIGLMGNARGILKQYSEAGMDFDMRPLGNGPDAAYIGSGGSALAVFNRRPHPNAARLFVNWIMSKRISFGLARAQGFDARRSDVPPLDPAMVPIPGGDYVYAQRSENNDLVRELLAEVRKGRPQ